jgi:murein DD-endopeptidase MepM/ murein hydrolase activator NlpD
MYYKLLKHLVFAGLLLAIVFGTLLPLPVAASSQTDQASQLNEANQVIQPVILGVNGALSAAPTPPAFSWPWTYGQSWQFTQGPHGTNFSGLDINNGALPWNSTARHEVRAAAAGTARRISNCYVIIDHGNGWSTGYVHIRAEIKNGWVAANQVIGILETNKSAAQCGGYAEAPHLHFRLLYNNVETSIIGATFSGWTVKVEDGYLKNPSAKRSMYIKNCEKKYIYQRILNNVGNPAPAGIVNGKTYSIHPTIDTNQALDIYGGKAYSDAKIAQWGFHGGPNQLWKAIQTGDGAFIFQSVLNNSYCLTVQNDSTSQGGKIVLYECNKRSSQTWRMLPVSGTTDTFCNLNSQLVMDVPGSKRDWGLQPQLWESNNTAAQKFTFIQR